MLDASELRIRVLLRSADSVEVDRRRASLRRTSALTYGEHAQFYVHGYGLGIGPANTLQPGRNSSHMDRCRHHRRVLATESTGEAR
jgi:hypothetical protein